MPIFLGVLFVIVCVLLIIVVLLQKGRGGGLGAAFGGAGSAAFGTRTGDVFTWVTIVLTGLFLLLAVGTTMIYRPEAKKTPSPSVLPPAAAISEPKSVVILAAKGTKTYYTLDGKTPDEKSKQYKGGQFQVQPGQTLKVRSFHSPDQPSDVVTAVFAEATTTSPATTTATAPATSPVAEKPATTGTAPATGAAR